MITEKVTYKAPESGEGTYILAVIDGLKRLVHWNGEYWEVDSTCRHINSLLDDGLISEESARGWIMQAA